MTLFDWRSSLLEQSLAPIWKLTYYGGFLPDWIHTISKSGSFFAVIRCFAIVVGFSSSTYQMVCSAVKFGQVVTNSNNHMKDIVYEAVNFIIQPMIVFIWAILLSRNNSIQVFFRDWNKQVTLSSEDTSSRSIDNEQIISIKRVTIAVYFISCSNVLVFLVLCWFCVLFDSDLSQESDIIKSYFPSISENLIYKIIKRSMILLQGIHYVVFYQMLDIVPIMVYYHASKVIQIMTNDVKRMNCIDNMNTTIADSLELIWSRFENLRMLLNRADHLFGPLIILCHGEAFFVTCSSVYSLLISLKHHDRMETNHDLTLKLSLYLCLFFYVIRILLNVFLIAKVGHSSGSLLTAVVNHSTHRSRASNIEERRVIKSFLGRLEHTTLGANP